jgi:hypothetical protein
MRRVSAFPFDPSQENLAPFYNTAGTLKSKHKVPPSYSRAGKGARSLNGTSG